MKDNRLVQLDILRAAAIILVMINHIPKEFFGDSVLWKMALAIKIGGWCGVDLFFVLSGFLVSGIYFREYKKHGTISIKNFLIRRGFKIYPVFYAFLGSAILINIFLLDHGVKLKNLLGEVLFLQNYVGSIFDVTWSLAVEEHFYIILTVIFFVLRKKFDKDIFRFLPQIFIAIAIMAFSFRLYAVIKTPSYNFMELFGYTHLRIDSLMFGVLLSYYYYFKPQVIEFFEKRRYIIIFFSLIALIPFFRFSRKYFDYYDVINMFSLVGVIYLYVIFGLIIVSFLFISIKRSVLVDFLSQIGKSSYSMYLWHVPILHLSLVYIEGLYGVIVYLITSVVWGIVFTKLIELPTLRLRDRLFPSKSGLIKSPEVREAQVSVQNVTSRINE